jgi:CheY-like chemotaxis protein
LIKDISVNNSHLNPIDILLVDMYSRVTLTKKFKKIISLHPEDKILVYQDKYSKSIVLKIQQEEKVLGSWSVIKNKDEAEEDYAEGESSITKTTNSNSSNNAGMGKNGTSDSISGNQNLNNNDYADDGHKTFGETKETGWSKGTYTKEEWERKGYDLWARENTLYNTCILLINDEQDLLLTYGLILKSEGYRNVKAFSDPREVLKHLLDLGNSSRYRLAIMDIRMPDINGIQLYKILKILNPSISVVFITALDAADELTSNYPEVKTADILRKPIGQNLFIEAINDKVSTLGIPLLLFMLLLTGVHNTLYL